MAVTDRKREARHNQKRGASYMVITYKESEILVDGSLYATLPANSVIRGITSVVTTASGTASATIQPVINGANYGTALAVTTAGSTNGTAALHLPTGGDVVLKAGVAPATGSLVGVFIVEYVELDKTVGEYTN